MAKESKEIVKKIKKEILPMLNGPLNLEELVTEIGSKLDMLRITEAKSSISRIASVMMETH